MNLADIHRTEGAAGLDRLAKRAGVSPKFLYQCATGRRFPSPKLGFRLVAADPRLDFESLYDRARQQPESSPCEAPNG